MGGAVPVLRRFIPLALALLLLGLPANTLAGPGVGGVVQGAGTASRITIYAHSSEHFEGVVHRHNYACVDCFLNLTIVSGEFSVFQDGQSFDLAPGVWQIREFKGYFGYTAVPGKLNEIDLRIEGSGHVMPV